MLMPSKDYIIIYARHNNRDFSAVHPRTTDCSTRCVASDMRTCFSMLEGSHTQQPKGRHQRDTRHRNLLVELSYRPAGDRRQVNTALEESRQHIADRYNNLDIHNNNHHHPEDEQYFHQHHKGHGHTVDRQFTEEDPTPTRWDVVVVSWDTPAGNLSAIYCLLGIFLIFISL